MYFCILSHIELSSNTISRLHAHRTTFGAAQPSPPSCPQREQTPAPAPVRNPDPVFFLIQAAGAESQRSRPGTQSSYPQNGLIRDHEEGPPLSFKVNQPHEKIPSKSLEECRLRRKQLYFFSSNGQLHPSIKLTM